MKKILHNIIFALAAPFLFVGFIFASIGSLMIALTGGEQDLFENY